jgi:hypothetical protein
VLVLWLRRVSVTTPNPILRLQDVIGNRGEKLVELCLTDYATFDAPLFRLSHLGEKWPAIDFYVELTTSRDSRPFFLVQTKSTTHNTTRRSLRISSTKHDIEQLLQIPAPTYLLGVHEPTRRVFVRSVHEGLTTKAITSISLANELTTPNLQRLHDEVALFWRTGRHKPRRSNFL